MKKLLFVILLLATSCAGQATAFLPPPPLFCWHDANGAPLVGGKVGVFLAGSTTPAATYTDAAAGGTNTNPVILDSSGCHPLWLGAGSFKFVMKDADDVVLFTTDNIPGGLGSVWGAITGTLGDQSDLVAALALKLNTSQLDTDATLAANSDSKIPSQKAVKAYAVPQTRTLTTTAPLVCDAGASCDLSANRTLGFGTKAKNTFFSGPSTGADAAPAFRALVAADMPALSSQGLQKIRITSVCTTGSSTYDECGSAMTGTWGTAFADTNYTVVCTGVNPSNPRAGPIYVLTKTTTAVTLNFPTEGSVAVTYGEIDCSGHE